jgi:hypothetical protein
MEVTVPPIVETQLTGKIGSASILRGKRRYTVDLVAGSPPRCSLDRIAVTPDYNKTMLRLVQSARKFFQV